MQTLVSARDSVVTVRARVSPWGGGTAFLTSLLPHTSRPCACAHLSPRQVGRIASKDPPKTLRYLSTASGLLLIMGGISGVFTINPLAAIISVYNILFGVLIVLTELKTWPVIRTFQKSVDVYFHLLSVPRGKGGFYCFIGLLAFFSSDWSLARVCVLIVSIVGVLHLFACQRCGAPADTEEGAHASQPMEYSAEAGNAAPSSDSMTWQGLMKQVVADSPEVLSAGLSTIGTVATAAGNSGSSGGGSGGGDSNGSGAATTGSDGLPQASTMKG